VEIIIETNGSDLDLFIDGIRLGSLEQRIPADHHGKTDAVDRFADKERQLCGHIGERQVLVYDTFFAVVEPLPVVLDIVGVRLEGDDAAVRKQLADAKGHGRAARPGFDEKRWIESGQESEIEVH